MVVLISYILYNKFCIVMIILKNNLRSYVSFSLASPLSFCILMFFSSVNRATVFSQQAKIQTSLSQGGKVSLLFSDTHSQDKNPQIWQLAGRSTDVTGLKALLKRYIFNMTRNSLTKFIKVVWANVGVVFVGVFPKKSQNPKLKQEIQGISWLRAD